MRLIHIFRVKNLINGISTIRISNLLTDHAKRRAFYYTDGLTGLRGYAALWVLIYHTWVVATPRLMSVEIGSYSIDLTPFFSCGWAGVDIFYTLSAFLLTLSFAEAAIEEKKGLRLFPYFSHSQGLPSLLCTVGDIADSGVVRNLRRGSQHWRPIGTPFYGP